MQSNVMQQPHVNHVLSKKRIVIKLKFKQKYETTYQIKVVPLIKQVLATFLSNLDLKYCENPSWFLLGTTSIENIIL